MYHWAVLALELRSYILLTELNQAHLPTYKVYSGHGFASFWRNGASDWNICLANNTIYLYIFHINQISQNIGKHPFVLKTLLVTHRSLSEQEPQQDPSPLDQISSWVKALGTGHKLFLWYCGYLTTACITTTASCSQRRTCRVWKTEHDGPLLELADRLNCDIL